MIAAPPVNPVLARELKQRMRGRYVWLVITLYLAVLAVILRWIYVASARDEFDGGFDLLASASAGRAIFQWLLFFMLLLVCFIVPGLTAGAISGERERQTMVALQLTLLRPRSIVVGKLLASLAFVLLLIVASLPLVTVPFLVGGVSLPEVVKGLLMVVATAVTLACLTLACSAVLRRTQAATVVAYGLTLALVLGTLLVYGAQQVPRRGFGPRPDPWILALNPFAATADVVQGRNQSSSFTSPFGPLIDLVRLDENERFTDVISGAGQVESIQVGPGGTVVVGRAVPATAGAGPGIAFDNFGQAVPADVGDGQARLAGIRFWVVSLAAWVLMAGLAVALTVRRISLPANRESP
ncbi:MAG TPA: ABC transporter permease subunit [Acidimicrobiales bacterium]|nr:ABC transporter permease subunit [Acidimicrobiales bacterium]